MSLHRTNPRMPKVHLPQARTIITAAPGQTILEAALEQGIAYPHGCRSGRCGNCKSYLIEGEVSLLEHTRFALSDDEKADGLILACRAQPNGDVTVAWLGNEDEQPSHRSRNVQCRVTAIDEATHDIRRLRLAVDGEPLTFSAGQYARLSFPGAPARDYSMANRPDQNELEFHVRRVPGGAASARIHDYLKVDDLVTLEGPFGSSYLRHGHSGPIVAVAGGSGLAPIQSIVGTALALGMRQPIHVYFGVRMERDLYLLEHFQALAAYHEQLTFTPVLTEAKSGTYRTGMVSTAVAEDMGDLDGWKAYVAGPPAMVEATMAVATAKGLRSQDLHADIFFTPDRLPQTSPAQERKSA
jgi:naphthalene 1,2-dioxygenase ferredoxin reductase component